MGKKNKTAAAKLPKSLRKGDLPRPVEEVWEAGVGALAQARKKGGDTFEALVHLGSRVVDTGGKAARTAVGQVESAADSVVQTARDVADGAVDGVQGRIEGTVEAILARVGVPGRDEVRALQAHVDALEARLVELQAEPAAPAAAPASAPAAERYEVRPHERGWAVQKAGAARATAVHPTKKEALRDGRQTAKAHAPSQLTIYKTDGSVGDVVEYDAD